MLGLLPPSSRRHLLQVARGGLHDQLAYLGGAGEGNLVDIRVGGQRRPGGLAEAGDHVHHAVRHAGLGDEPGQPQRGQRSLLGGLEHDGVPGGQRRPSFHAAISSGKFHGMICPTTPTGSRSV